MGKKHSVLVATACLAICLALIFAVSGCYVPGGPAPEGKKQPAPRDWTQAQVEQVVLSTQESIYSPAPRDNGTPPADADYIRFLRFRPRDYSGNPQDADAILVLMPGFLCGSNAFEYLGPQMVYMAKTQRNIDLEVWGTERRGNDLEDRAGVVAAEASANSQVAVDYYYHGSEINGKKFGGFLASEQAPYLSEFGLKLCMEDLYKVITTMVPDPQVRRQKVFVGGHSLGGILTALFAGWDFDGNPETTDDAGYRNCAGYAALDSMISASSGPVSDELKTILDERVSERPADMTDEEYYISLLQGLRDGSVPRILQFPGVTQEAMLLLELLGMDANFAPDSESTLLKRIPISDSLDMLLRVLHSRSLDQFLLPMPHMTQFRYTNEAAFGVVLDDNYMPLTIMQASMGFLNGGAVVRKDFPFPSDFANIPAFANLIGGFICLKDMFIANDAGPDYANLGTGPLYTWADYDEIGDAQDPDYTDTTGTQTYTTTQNEVSDIHDVADVIYHGASNLPEWYFTSRFSQDIEYATRPWASKYGLEFLHGDHVNDLPKIEFRAEQGPTKSMFGFDPPPAENLIMGYNHIDVLTASANTSSHRPNEVFMPLIDFMLAHRTQAAAKTPKTVKPTPVVRRVPPAKPKKKTR